MILVTTCSKVCSPPQNSSMGSSKRNIVDRGRLGTPDRAISKHLGTTQAPHDVPENRASGAPPMGGLGRSLDVTWVRPYRGLILSELLLSSTACPRLDRTRGLVW